MFSNSFIQELIKYKNNSRLIVIINLLSSLICTYLILTTPKGLNKLTITLVGILNAVAGLNVAKIDNTLDTRLHDLQITSRLSSKNLLEEYLSDRNNIKVELTKPPIEERNIISDIVSHWVKQDKHLLLVGSTGDGKSTAIKIFTSNLNNVGYKIDARDIDATVDDYSSDIEVTFDYKEIEQTFNNDLLELEQRIKVRRVEGKKFNPEYKFIVSEELPALVDEIEVTPTWIKRMSNRGRKVKLFLCVAAQNDTVDALGLKGNSKLINNFVKLYLGTKAIERAKQLKDDVLLNWLQAQRYGRGLIDDCPCLINISNLDSTSLTTTIPKDTLTSEIPHNDAISGNPASEVPQKTPQNAVEIAHYGGKSEDELITMGKILKNEGYSKTKIIKLLFSVEGGNRFTDLSKKLDG